MSDLVKIIKYEKPKFNFIKCSVCYSKKEIKELILGNSEPKRETTTSTALCLDCRKILKELEE